jgi:hypothetical protein
VGNHGGWCVKEIFSGHVKTNGEVTALFPFQRLAHSFRIAGFGYAFDPEKECVMALVDHSNPKAVSKVEHYIAALDTQLEVCTRIDARIDRMRLSRRPGECSR